MVRRYLPKATVICLLTIALVVIGIEVERDHRDASASTTSASATTAARRPQKHVVRAAPRAVDPLRVKALRRYIDSRRGGISIAIEDLRTRGTYVWNPRERAQTASIVKADILETLLRDSMVTRAPLGEETREVAEDMIEESDNDDATELWNQVGGASGIAAYDRRAGLKQTDPGTDGYWGETTTSALDQIRLLRQLVDRHVLLDRASQRYQLGLMQHVTPDQRWGVSGGVPSGVQVALKNGWVPLTGYGDWEVNSIGRIRGDGRWYLIAVLTAHDPSEQYGIDTIERISSYVWKALRRR